MLAWSDKLVILANDDWFLPGGRCRICNAQFHPDRFACPRCGSDSVDSIELQRIGTIKSSTLVHQTGLESLIRPPYWLALIELDKGPVIEAVGSSQETIDDAAVGTRVELILEPLKAEPEIGDLLMYRFRPLVEEGRS